MKILKYQIVANGDVIHQTISEGNAINELSWYEFYLEKYPDNEFLKKQIKLFKELLESNN